MSMQRGPLVMFTERGAFVTTLKGAVIRNKRGHTWRVVRGDRMRQVQRAIDYAERNQLAQGSFNITERRCNVLGEFITTPVNVAHVVRV